MKYLILVIIASLVLTREASAQYNMSQQPLIKVDNIPLVDGKVFPLGAVIAGTTNGDSLHSAFLNVYSFYQWTSGNQPMGQFADSLLGIQGGSILRGYVYYNETRNYLFSGYDDPVSRPYDFATQKVNGKSGFHHQVGSIIDEEYKISGITAPLDTLVNGEDTLPGYLGNYLLREPIHDMYKGNHVLYNPSVTDADTFYYDHHFDFMYRFDSTEIIDIPPGIPLYYVDIWIKGAKPHSGYDANERWLKYDTILTIPITKDTFYNAMATSHDSHWKNSDLEHGVSVYRPNFKKYDRIRISFSDTMMRHYFFDGLDSSTSPYLTSRYKSGEIYGADDDEVHRNSVRFDVRLRRDTTVTVPPIYVKGIRIRDGGAERLLTGQLDALLALQFDSIKNSWYKDEYGNPHQGEYYDNLININIEAEPFPHRYYIMGYLDRYARDNGFKRITSFTPGYPKQSRLIWDDILWKSGSPNEAPEHLWRNIDYTTIYEARNLLPGEDWDNANRPHLMAALPIDVLPKSRIGQDGTGRDVVIDSLCNMFTQRVAGRTDSAMHRYELEHDSVFRHSFRSDLREVNEAAFSLGSKRIPFWIMGQAFFGYYMVESGDSNWYKYKLISNQERPKRTLAELTAYLLPIIDSLQQTPGATYEDFLYNMFDGAKLYDTARIGYDRGHVSAEAIRLQANVSAAWGASGYHVSNAGANGTTDNGFNTVNHTHRLTDPARFKYEHDAEVPTPGVPLVGSADWFSIGTDSCTMYTITDTCGTWTWRFTTDPNAILGPCESYNKCADGTKARIYPRHYDGPTILSTCNSGWPIRGSLPTFYGFKTRYRGAKWGFGDLNYAAEKLAKLTWSAAWDVSGRDTLPARYLDSLPIDNISTVLQKKKRMPSEFDPNYKDSFIVVGPDTLLVTDDEDKRFVEVGVFRDNDEVSTRYVYVVNRRVWPNRTSNDTSTNNKYLGNVAVRNIRFKVKPQMFGKDSNYVYWEVTDYKKPHQVTLFHRDSLYKVLLQPGEGRLFRIAPSISAALGEMSTNRYNNARHIAAIEREDTVDSYAAIYEADGNINVTYTYEAPANDPIKRSIDTPSEILIDTGARNGTPAIAYHITRNKVGVIYVKRIAVGPSMENLQILFSKAYDSTQYTFSAPQLLSTFNAPKGHVASPSIAYAPAGGSFWVAWNDTSKGAVIRLLEINTDTVLPHAVDLFKNDASKVRFVSLATRDEILDSVFVAFEEGTSTNAHIYFASVGFYYDGVNDSMFIENPVTRISWGHGTCKNYNPQICISNDKKVSVVWDAIGHSITVLGQPKKPTSHYAMLRQRDSVGQWSKFTAFRVFYRPDGITNDSLRSYPNIAFSTKDNFPMMNESSNRWDDKVRITWNNPTTEMVGIARQGFTLFDTTIQWRMHDLLQPSLEPAMPILSLLDTVVQPLMYRAPNRNSGTGLFDVRITHMDFPITNVKRITRPVAKITAGTTGFLCAPMISGVIETEVKFARKDSSDIDTNRIGDTPPWATQPFHDSVYNPITWNSQKIRSNNFMLYTHDTIRYDRFFHVGTFAEGDTANAKEALYDSSDYVKIRVLLRNSYDHSILNVLDSCIITKLGYSQSTVSALDTTRTYISPSAHVDSVYISFEADRGNAANDYEVFSTFVYDDYVVDAFPEDGPAFKQANANPTPSAHQSHSTPLLVTVNPNPFSGSTTINVETQKGLPFLIEVYDLLGKRLGTVYNGISEQEKDWFTLGREMLTPGTYFVRVQAGSQIQTRKIELLK